MTFSSAEISPCARYRYVLRRRWTGDVDGGRSVVFVMLNPSTADGISDDPTVRRCIGFAKRWGFDGLAVVNLFALRTPNPGSLAVDHDPVGPDNDAWIKRVTSDATAPIIVAWGAHGEPYIARVKEVVGLMSRGLRSLRKLKSGHPAHPLMLPYGLAPVPWELPR